MSQEAKSSACLALADGSVFLALRSVPRVRSLAKWFLTQA